VRGDAGVGKTCLFKRLQGENFVADHVETAEINVANIAWSYKGRTFACACFRFAHLGRGSLSLARSLSLSSDGRRDQGRDLGRCRQGQAQAEPAQYCAQLSSPISHSFVMKTEDMPLLDAANVDVYKSTHAVVFVYDIRKKWTFDYIVRELPNVPAHISVLVLVRSPLVVFFFAYRTHGVWCRGTLQTARPSGRSTAPMSRSC